MVHGIGLSGVGGLAVARSRQAVRAVGVWLAIGASRHP